MSTVKPQAISGVSANAESVITAVWPSIAANGLCRMFGGLYGKCRVMGIPLGAVALAPLTAPIAALVFMTSKAFGNRYVLTNRAVQVWNSIGTRQRKEVLLTEIGRVKAEMQDGYEWYNAADIVLYDHNNGELLRLPAVASADVFQQNILKAKQARVTVDDSLKQIQNR